MSSFAQFQESMGKGVADIQVGMAPILRIIFIIGAIICAIFAFVPLQSGPAQPPSSNLPCAPLLPCANPNETCQNNHCVVTNNNPPPKSRHPWFLIGTAVLLFMAWAVVPFSQKMQQIVYSNPNAGIAAGTMAEAGMVADIFNPRR